MLMGSTERHEVRFVRSWLVLVVADSAESGVPHSYVERSPIVPRALSMGSSGGLTEWDGLFVFEVLHDGPQEADEFSGCRDDSDA
jgi:hypothetical protein